MPNSEPKATAVEVEVSVSPEANSNDGAQGCLRVSFDTVLQGQGGGVFELFHGEKSRYIEHFNLRN
jgi:hypothetical protein